MQRVYSAKHKALSFEHALGRLFAFLCSANSPPLYKRCCLARDFSLECS